MGRKKIEMEMVKDSSSRQVTFSKRRTGVFKKANELSTLCEAEIAIVVFSPGGKPFSFGNPDVETIVKRFLNGDPPPKREPNSGSSSKSNEDRAEVNDLNKKMTAIVQELEEEKKKGEMIEKKLGKRSSVDVDAMELDELRSFKNKLEEAREKIRAQVSEIEEASSSLLLLAKEPVRDHHPID